MTTFIHIIMICVIDGNKLIFSSKCIKKVILIIRNKEKNYLIDFNKIVVCLRLCSVNKVIVVTQNLVTDLQVTILLLPPKKVL